MINSLKQFLAQFGQLWKNIGINQRVTIILVGLVFMAAIYIMAGVAKRPSWGVLYAGISQEESGKICSVLRDEGIPFRLKEGGRTIQVPEQNIDTMKVLLAEKRLLPSHDQVSSVDLFGKGSFADTEQIQKVKIRMDTESRIARTIMAMSSVGHASVMLAIPEESIFDDSPEVTASVMLTLTEPLSKENVRTIQYAVSHSVAGLKMGNVTVLSSDGRTLSDTTGDDDNFVTSSNLEYQHMVEKKLTESAQSMLDRAIGPGKTIVRVSALINFERKVETKNEPTKGVKTKENSKSTKTEGQDPVAGGTPGATQNSGMSAAAVNFSTNKSEDKDEETVYQPGFVQTETVYAVGDIKKLTIAVAVDSEVTTDLTTLQEVVKKAVGFRDDKIRQDEIAVSTIEFHKPEAVAAEPSGGGGGSSKIMGLLIRNVAALVGVVVVLFFFMKMFKKAEVAVPAGMPAAAMDMNFSSQPEMSAPIGTPQPNQQEATPENAFFAANETPAPQTFTQPASGTEQRDYAYTDKVNEMADNKPEELAGVVSRWINQG